MLRHQDSNLVLTAPKAVVLPLHHGGPRRQWPGATLKSAMAQRLPRGIRSRHPASGGIMAA